MKVNRKLIAALVVGLIIIAAVIYVTIRQQAEIRVKEQKNAVSAAVQNYNRMLIEAQKKLDVNKMNEVATLKQAKEVGLLLAYYGQKLNAHETDKLSNFQVESVELNGSTAKVMTKEVWSIKQESLKDKSVIFEGDVFYTAVYSLIQEQNKWLVDGVESTEINQKK